MFESQTYIFYKTCNGFTVRPLWWLPVRDARLLATENDEASKRILQELREALHKNYKRLG
jgi:hypothetical protein